MNEAVSGPQFSARECLNNLDLLPANFMECEESEDTVQQSYAQSTRMLLMQDRCWACIMPHTISILRVS